MSSKIVRDPTRTDPTLVAAPIGIALFVVVGGGLSVAMRLGTEQSVPLNPIAIVAELSRGVLVWTTGATVVAAGLGVLVLAAGAGIAVWMGKRLQRRTWIDDRARYLGRGREIRSITDRECRRTAQDLGVTLTRTQAAGVQIGRHLLSGRMLRGTFQDLHAHIWGPRSGKSSSIVIPAILDAPGAVITTSNKRDVVDATRLLRSKHLRDIVTGEEVTLRQVDWTTYRNPTRKAKEGLRHLDSLADRPVWVFDPQQVAGEPASWWWNPLSWVADAAAASVAFSSDDRSVRSGAEVRAADLADFFAEGDDGQDAKKDSFFDPEGQDLITALFLAAAIANRPITDVYTWVTDEQEQEAVVILRRAGYSLQADGLAAQYNAPDKQRGGVFGTAKKMIRSLKVSAIHPWVTRVGDDDERPHFDPREFIASGGTLYSLSLEGNGSAGPIVSALTAAVIEAATEKATASPKGRLPVPMICPLDEIANVVRWSKLPSLYSHFGSRGIIIMAILQSYSQGVDVWGQRGMEKLWSAANVKVYGGGVAVGEDGFLRAMSTAIGDHKEITGSVSHSSSGRSVSRQRTDVRTFPESDLEALPRGRAIVRSSGNRPTLVRTVPWWDGQYAEQVTMSIRAHDPVPDVALAAATTIVDELGSGGLRS